MSEFDHLPYIFNMAHKESGKTHLTYDEYMSYVNRWNEMSEEMRLRYFNNVNIHGSVHLQSCKSK